MFLKLSETFGIIAVYVIHLQILVLTYLGKLGVGISNFKGDDVFHFYYKVLVF